MIYPWEGQRRFNSYNLFLLQHFGGRLQKLTLNAGFTCPNRDGTVGYGGCTYCLNEAFNPAYCTPQKSITRQLDDGITFHHHRRGNPIGYVAYFQTYSNTFAPISLLKARFEEALSHQNIQGLIIATRPDCLSDEILDYLELLQERTFLSLEIGIESFHDKTLQRIHRGHDVACTLNTLERLRHHHLTAGAHLIFGLPNETPDTWLNDLTLLNTLPLHSLKFHQLQILKDTAMEQDYLTHTKDFYPLSVENYLHFLVTYLEHLNPAFVIERFTSEVPPRYLSVTPWGKMRYDTFLQKLEQQLAKQDTWQGKQYHGL